LGRTRGNRIVVQVKIGLNGALGGGGRREIGMKVLSLITGIAIGVTCVLSTAVWAGGSNFGDDDDPDADEGPAYFGFVRDIPARIATAYGR
jgi:hypothetical protein